VPSLQLIKLLVDNHCIQDVSFLMGEFVAQETIETKSVS